MREKILEIVSQQLGLPVDRLEESKTLNELGADSLDVMEIQMELETEGISITDEQWANIKTLGDLIVASGKNNEN